MKEKFLQVYANVPLGLRSEIIAVLDDFGPVSWNAAYFEIIDDTENGQKILEKLKLLNII